MYRDCWLDPYGRIYYVPRFKHDDAAQYILRDEFPMEDKTTPMRTGPLRVELWDERGFCNSFGETLEKRGWIQFTTTINRWACEHCIDYERHYPKPTRAQIGRMWELTGFNYYDENSWSEFDNFDHDAPDIITIEDEEDF